MPGDSGDEINDFIDENDYNNSEEEGLESDTFDDVSEEEEEYESDTSLDETPKKSRAKSRKRRNPGDLILREVEEVSGDEDEEDTLVAEDGFKEMEKLMREREAYGDFNKRRSSRIDYAIRDADHDQLEELAKRWTETASRDEFLDVEGDSIAQPTTSVHKKRLLPTIKDPSLWMVRCQMGQEANAVLALMRKSLFLKKNGDPISILSAVYQNGIKGFIYVEAHKQSHVKAALQGLSYFTYGINKQKMVPLAEMPQVLKVVKETVLVEPNSWIRIKRGEYRNDLAQVESVDKVKNSAVVKLIPRIDYRQINKTSTDNNGSNNNSNKDSERKFFRAEPALFNIDNIRREGGILTQDSSGFYMFGGNRYKEGLLYKRFPIKSLIVSGVEPRLNELERFKAATDDRYSNEFSITLNKSTTANGVVSTSKESQKSTTTESFKIGDLVQLINGELMDSVGHIVAIEGDSVQVKLDKHDTSHASPIVEVLMDDLRKHFAIGDNVAVISGEHQGQVGMVVRVEHPYVIVFSNDSFSEMKVFSHNLHKTTSRFSGVDSSGKFQVGEFIRIDSNTVGCITKIHNDTVEFLNQMGKTNTSKIYNIQKYVPKRGFFRDKFNSPISIGDTVRVVGVDSLRDVVGQIKMLVYEWAFVYSPMIRKERGLFTCKSRNLVVESNAQNNHLNSGGVGGTGIRSGGGGLMSSGGMDSVNIAGGGGNIVGSPSIGSPAFIMSPRVTTNHHHQSVSTGVAGGNTSLQYEDSSRFAINNQHHSGYTALSTNIKKLRGKTVRIVHGPYKGYYGIVRDYSCQMARIELHTNSKTISANISEFICEGEDRPMTAGGHTPISSVNTPYSYGNKSVHHTPRHHHHVPETPGGSYSSYNHGAATPHHIETVTNTPTAYGNTTPHSGFIGSMHDLGGGGNDDHQSTNDNNSYSGLKSRNSYNPTSPPDSSSNNNNNSSSGYNRANNGNNSNNANNVTSVAAANTVFNLMSLGKDFEVKLTATHNKYPNAVGKVVNKSFNSCTIILKSNNEVITIADPKQLLLVAPAIFDSIEVVSGENQGKRGKLLSVSASNCTVELISADGRKNNVHLPLSNIVKICTSF